MSRPVKVSAVLRKLGACRPALAWVRRWERRNPGTTLAQMWVACGEEEWSAWLVWKLARPGTALWDRYRTIMNAFDCDPKPGAFRRAVGWLHWPAVEAAFMRAAAEVETSGR